MQNTDLASASIDHVLTGRFVSVRPFDLHFSEAMQNTMLTLTTGGAPVVLAYTQSDEITVVLDLGTPPTTPWVGGRTWEDELPEHLRLGVFAVREAYVKDVLDIGPVTRHRWVPTIMDARQMRAHLVERSLL